LLSEQQAAGARFVTLVVSTSPVATGGLDPQTKLQAPPNSIMKHYTSVDFLSNFRMSSPPE